MPDIEAPDGEIEDEDERKPDTVVVTFPTFVDVVVNLATGETKYEYEGEFDREKAVCATVWAEGELLAESDSPGHFDRLTEPADRAALDRALKIIRKEA